MKHKFLFGTATLFHVNQWREQGRKKEKGKLKSRKGQGALGMTENRQLPFSLLMQDLIYVAHYET